MPGKEPWFERKFSFSFPAARFPDVIERLRGTPARVEERIGCISAEQWTRRQGETWSIQENVGHFIDLEPLWTGRLQDFLAGEETLREADLTNRKTHQANHNVAEMEGLLTSFRRVREDFVARLEALGDEDFSRTALHPRLKQPMRLVDLCLFVADHDDYHLARIAELNRQF